MHHLPEPFGPAARAPHVVWPAWTGPPGGNRRRTHPPELWERGPASEASTGQLVLADLPPECDVPEALLIVARYLVVRIALFAGSRDPSVFNIAAERTAARDYLAAIDPVTAERRWLTGVLDAARRRPGRALLSRLNAAGAAAARGGHVHGAFSLYSASYEIAVHHAWHAEAARAARAIAAAATRGGGLRSSSLWSRRARVHEARAAQ
jgi:hypothetical protein